MLDGQNLYFDLRRIVLTFLVFDNFSLSHALMFQTTSRLYRHLMLLLTTLILNLSSSDVVNSIGHIHCYVYVICAFHYDTECVH